MFTALVWHLKVITLTHTYNLSPPLSYRNTHAWTKARLNSDIWKTVHLPKYHISSPLTTLTSFMTSTPSSYSLRGTCCFQTHNPFTGTHCALRPAMSLTSLSLKGKFEGLIWVKGQAKMKVSDNMTDTLGLPGGGFMGEGNEWLRF